MKIGVVILCRFDSSRLRGKILIDIEGKPVIDHIIKRVERAMSNCDSLIVATSEEKSDDPIAAYCQRFDVNCYRGSKLDVSTRFIEAGEQINADYTVRINGDNLFVDSVTLRDMLGIARSEKYEFITNVPGRTFPYGMSIEILNTKFYRELLKNFVSPESQEHVTSWLYENEGVGSRYVHTNRLFPELSSLQLALDTSDDLQRCIDLTRYINANQHKSELEHILEYKRHVKDAF